VNRCENCWLWGRGEAPLAGFAPGTKKHCSLYVYQMRPEQEASCISSEDFTHPSSSLWTEPDFGCLRFMGKPKQPSSSDFP
jgi:hypothetical protein